MDEVGLAAARKSWKIIKQFSLEQSGGSVAMPSYKLAHIREQGQDMLLFPLADRFGQMSSNDQNELLRDLEMRANSAGLAGAAAVFWRHGGHEHFMGPQPWHPFLRSVGMDFVRRNLNQQISW